MRCEDPSSGGSMPAHDRPELSLVICTLNEADSIGPVLREVEAVLRGVRHEILVVDDSPDEATANAVRAFAALCPAVRLVRRSGPRGLASAAIAGWDEAKGEVLAIMDGDGQHEAGLLPAMLDMLADEASDIVIASRYLRKGPSGLTGLRDVGSRLATLATFVTLGVYSSDPLSGFFVMRRSWYERARNRLSGVGFKILVDLLASGRRRPTLSEVRTALRPRIGGESKLDARVVVELLALLVEKRTNGLIPTRFCLFAMIGASGLGVHLAILSLALAAFELPFWAAQAAATLCAMTTNFVLNNALTFRDRRLTGRNALRGLLTFWICCSGGALVSEIVGSSLDGLGLGWLLAGTAGAVSAALVNYAAAGRATWRGQSLAGSARETSAALRSVPITPAE
ncbi:glycosyltransferase [Aurantimonas sp. MSK8Z-1]|uniref:glycosyltransferase n=1 Tax=Mangrovibrevibacter kandeliae TaxID=2968473 RepID=UPI0021196481|nr:glycosyltransferase [Aurantimonas sp. MSK8Z-1]MCW4113351.1 glycosyltransferase [Aurantimonas sp. MSK8Z-1]